MNQNELIKIWEESDYKGADNEFTLSATTVEAFLKPKMAKLSWSFNFNLIINFLAALASIIFLSINIYGYYENHVMLAIESCLMLLSIIFLVYGIFIYRKLKEINNYSKNLVELIHAKLDFIKFYFEIWLVVIAFIISILIFSINSLVDNQEGQYRINNICMYIAIHTFILVLVYATNKFSSYISVQKMKLYLKQLKSESVESVNNEAILEKRKSIVLIIVIIVITTLLLAGVIRTIGIL